MKVNELVKKGEQLAETDVEIKTDADVEFGIELIKSMKDLYAQIDEAMGPQVKAAHKAWKVALEQKKRFLDPLDDAMRRIKLRISRFRMKQEKLAEKKRFAAEAAAKRAEDRRRKALAKKAAVAKTELEREIIEEQIEDVFVPVKHVAKPGKVAGMATTADIDVRVDDINRLIRAIGTGKIYMDCTRIFAVKAGPLKQYVKISGLKSLPGCRIIPKQTISVRR